MRRPNNHPAYRGLAVRTPPVEPVPWLWRLLAFPLGLAYVAFIAVAALCVAYATLFVPFLVLLAIVRLVLGGS